MQLENMMEMYQPMQMQRTQERQRVYTLVDLESLSASALYTNERITDLKSSGFQFHFHENCPDFISSPKLKVGNEEVLKLSNYEAAMGDFYAQKLDLPTIRKGS